MNEQAISLFLQYGILEKPVAEFLGLNLVEIKMYCGTDNVAKILNFLAKFVLYKILCFEKKCYQTVNVDWDLTYHKVLNLVLLSPIIFIWIIG